MATDENTQNPFTRPSFIVAAIVIALVVVLGLTLAILNATRADPPPEPQPTATAATATTEPTVDVTTKTSSNESVCGLGAGPDEVPVSAPEALWEYQGTIAYPTSEKYGPGAEDPSGFRYCFQHSPTGALFAAANAAAQGSDPAIREPWLDYAVGSGPYRDDLMAKIGAGSAQGDSRLILQGFRLLNYDSASARVDLGARVSVDGQATYVSGVYELVWQDGDWKISTDLPEPLSTTAIPDLVGYIAWGE